VCSRRRPRRRSPFTTSTLQEEQALQRSACTLSVRAGKHTQTKSSFDAERDAANTRIESCAKWQDRSKHVYICKYFCNLCFSRPRLPVESISRINTPNMYKFTHTLSLCPSPTHTLSLLHALFLTHIHAHHKTITLNSH